VFTKTELRSKRQNASNIKTAKNRHTQVGLKHLETEENAMKNTKTLDLGAWEVMRIVDQDDETVHAVEVRNGTIKQMLAVKILDDPDGMGETWIGGWHDFNHTDSNGTPKSGTDLADLYPGEVLILQLRWPNPERTYLFSEKVRKHSHCAPALKTVGIEGRYIY